MLLFVQSVLMAVMLVYGVGCQQTYKEAVTGPTQVHGPLTSKSRIYVALPSDAMDKKATVPGSGTLTAKAMVTALTARTRGVFIGKAPEPLEDSLAAAHGFQCDYAIITTLVKWEDRPTEWTGVRDKLTLQIDLYDVRTGQKVDSRQIEGKSAWMNDGDDRPEHLLKGPIDNYVGSLFRVLHSPTLLN
ncbi:MAG: DUF4823 domain-containing protein [Verrucomicrobiota bacterium]|nr:DUF4823 domain-containing protein [Verrucomicrobiota bacterium]